MSKESNLNYITEKNTGENWPVYKRCIEVYAYSLDALSLLRGEDPEPIGESVSPQVKESWTKKNRSLFYVLSNTQTDATRMHVDMHEIGDTAKAWSSLLAFFESKTKASIKQLSNRLISMKQTGTVAQFIHDVSQSAEQLRQALKDRKVDLLDILVGGILLDGLSQEYAIISTTLLLDDDLSIEDCKRKLLEASERKKFEDESEYTNDYAIALKVFKRPPCPGCKKTNPNHPVDRCYVLHPELKPNRGATAAKAAETPNNDDFDYSYW